MPVQKSLETYWMHHVILKPHNILMSTNSLGLEKGRHAMALITDWVICANQLYNYRYEKKKIMKKKYC